MEPNIISIDPALLITGVCLWSGGPEKTFVLKGGGADKGTPMERMDKQIDLLWANIQIEGFVPEYGVIEVPTKSSWGGNAVSLAMMWYAFGRLEAFLKKICWIEVLCLPVEKRSKEETIIRVNEEFDMDWNPKAGKNAKDGHICDSIRGAQRGIELLMERKAR